MPKRSLTPTSTTSKRTRISKTFTPNKVATQDAAAAVDSNPPLVLLEQAMGNMTKNPQEGGSVIYWMRMADLRIRDNRALSRASERAKQHGIPLLAVFILSPQDYIAHDRSPRRIDFTLRNLAVLKKSLSELHIPFHVTPVSPRKMIPSFVLSFCEKYGARSLFSNIEYEVDELRRDLELCKLASQQGIQINLSHNKCVIEPGVITTKQGKPYAMYSPFQRNWISTVNNDLGRFVDECPYPSSNDQACRSSAKFGPLFNTSVPESVEGFELDDFDKMKMCEIWPEGEDVALKMLQAFLSTRARKSQIGATSPLATGAEKSDKQNRISRYEQDRDRVDRDSTSRLSVYLSSGVISVRECLRLTMEVFHAKKVEGNNKSGVGRWIQEIAWRDFYTNILACFPRVCMGRPFMEKYSKVVWEDGGADSESVKRWKGGKTGVPIVDAAMRCLNELGWMHNRARMICAMYLVKDLMIDWHVGEQYFMQKLIDGDLASNNGGWQWCSSTGVDPVPYFRIFNPYTQSEKADGSGEFIRHWVPELGKLRDQDIHNPPIATAEAIGYPLPIIAHNEARQRALRRFGKPGME